MNKVIMMPRLVADPEQRSAANGTTIVSFRGAVDRRFKREGQPDADFFNFTAFGKTGEFVAKYFSKGQRMLIEGEIQNDNYTDKEGKQVYGQRIIVNQVEFCESKNSSNASNGGQPSAPQQTYTAAPQQPVQPVPQMTAPPAPDDGFMNIPDGIEDELPFN